MIDPPLNLSISDGSQKHDNKCRFGPGDMRHFVDFGGLSRGDVLRRDILVHTVLCIPEIFCY